MSVGGITNGLPWPKKDTRGARGAEDPHHDRPALQRQGISTEPRLKGCRGHPYISSFQMSRRRGAWRRSSHAHMHRRGANTRIRTHDRGEHTRSNPRGDKGNDRVPALSTSIIAPKSFYRYSYRGQQSTHKGGDALTTSGPKGLASLTAGLTHSIDHTHAAATLSPSVPHRGGGGPKAS